MRDLNLLGTWVRRFLLEHLVAERNLSRNTQMSYRDTLSLLLPFASTKVRKSVDRLNVFDLSPSVIRAFLETIEAIRNCSVTTRNQRLGAIHSLAKFIGMRSPEHVSWCAEVRSIPFKKSAKSMIGYLDKSEMDALLNQPIRSTSQGSRDYALLLFLYNSGARADEAAGLTIDCLQVGTSPCVRILGKGNKLRLCPLWPLTVAALKPLISDRDAQDRVFLGRTGDPMTRFGIHRLVTTYAALALGNQKPLKCTRVSPHTIRHTTAVHLLRSGVDINTIRAWLGHVSLDTTHIYAEVDLEMKAKALARVNIESLPKPSKNRGANNSVMAFLSAL